MRAFQVSELDNLMTHKAGATICQRQMSFPFLQLNGSGERRCSHAVREHYVATGDTCAIVECCGVPTCVHDSPSENELRAESLGLRHQKPCNTWRIYDCIILHKKRTGQARTQVWFGFGERFRIEYLSRRSALPV